MAHVLKKNRVNTLRKELLYYQGLILGVALLMAVSALSVLLIKDYSYSHAMRQVLSLNQYYIQLDQTDKALLDFVGSGEDEAGEDVEEEARILARDMEILRRLGAGTDFQRDIEDIASIQENGLRLIGQIEEKLSGGRTVLTSSEYVELKEKYQEISEIFERIGAEFKPLHLQLLNFASSRMEYLAKRGNFYYLFFLSFLAALSFYGVVWGKYLNDRIVSPVQLLTCAAKEIRDGKILEQKVIVLDGKTYQEVTVLVDVFNRMVGQIQEQILTIQEDMKTKEALREKELENLRISNLLRTSELQSFQRQMNPHFLFNTLNIISKNAYLEGDGKTAFLLQRTAHLLRYSLDYMGKAVTLAQEVEMLGDYVYLQEQRFGKRIQFRFDLDESFHQTHVPCFILQPLVENSIVHGVGSYIEGGRITIQTSRLGRDGMILISDNGKGMPEDVLERLRGELESAQKAEKRIGLANVCQRLDIFFGHAARMELVSEPGKGTQVRIRIPLEKKEEASEENGKTSDRR